MKKVYLHLSFIMALGILAWACSDDASEVNDIQGSARFLQEKLTVGSPAGEATVLVEWSATSWEVVMDVDKGVITTISPAQGGSAESEQQFTRVKFSYSENTGADSRTQDVFIVNKTTKERKKLTIEQEAASQTVPYSLENYSALKSYINRTSYPVFKLGIAVTVSEFLQKQNHPIYEVARSNFEEMVAGNAMKYSSVVKSDGTMNFTEVTNFVNAARDAGLGIYGHTLCWHAQQNNTYLNSIIAPVEVGGDVLITDFESDALGKTYPMSGNGTATVMNDPDNQNGKVLHVGGSANYSFPKIEVKLPAGKTLADCKSVVLDMKAPGTGGLWGGGMRLQIIGMGSEATYDSPATFGCADGQWGKKLIELSFDKLNLTDANKLLNEFTIQVGSGTTSADYYIDNVRIKWKVAGQIVAKTEKEKADILTSAMENWVKGMMTACGGYVKAWDLVNEPMSDGTPSALKSASTESNASENFYWQDYLGKDYTRVVAKFARQYGPADIKLFINDYNLEASYNNNKKCEGLIEMIKYWEADGVTKIDGIGTQMHVTCSMDAATQKKTEDAVVRMLQLLSATGKLIKISELDMGLIPAGSSENIKTVNMTEAQHKTMAKFYNFIIRKYFEIIPASQQYGITQWCSTDSPENSYWRKGQPVGLWDLEYNRKHAYAGFADGLAGKEY